MVPMVNAANADKNATANKADQAYAGSDANAHLVILANLTSKDAVLQYSVVATSPTKIVSVALTPRIWRHDSGGMSSFTLEPLLHVRIPQSAKS